MSLVGKGKHFFVASAVAKSFYVVFGAIEREAAAPLLLLDVFSQGFGDAQDFFRAIAIGGLELARYFSLRNFYLGSQYFNTFQSLLRKEWSHPIVDACADNQYLVVVLNAILYELDASWSQQVLAIGGESRANLIEILFFHTSEEVFEYHLLGFPVWKKMQFHRRKNGAVKQEAQEELPVSLGISDKLNEGVFGGQCAIKVKAKYLSLFHFSKLCP